VDDLDADLWIEKLFPIMEKYKDKRVDICGDCALLLMDLMTSKGATLEAFLMHSVQLMCHCFFVEDIQRLLLVLVFILREKYTPEDIEVYPMAYAVITECFGSTFFLFFSRVPELFHYRFP